MLSNRKINSLWTPASLTPQEARVYARQIETATWQELKEELKNPDKARSILVSVGVLTPDGELAPAFRRKREDTGNRR